MPSDREDPTGRLASVATSDRARVELEQLAVSPPAGPVVLSGPGAKTAALALADMFAGPSSPDRRVASPDADRWTVDELSDRVVTPVSFAPRRRHCLVVDAADRIPAATADRLLKLIEEPPSPVVFLLVVADSATLPATLRGRAVATVDVPLADPTVRADRLAEAADVDRDVARRAVAAAGRLPELAEVLAADLDLLDTVEQLLDAPASSSTPLSHADGLADRAETSASQLTDVFGTGTAGTRELTRLLLDRWRDRAVAVAREATSAAVVDRAAGLLDACDRAVVALDRNVAPGQALVLATVAAS